ncbi:solute carrier family 22 member 21-like [Clavelina lepadiformis]|uniref:solute carrier family 22 member 21-like n=1 Tax=Clavelina lepadiformis TaxID=159417 RepID=UPI004041829A
MFSFDDVIEDISGSGKYSLLLIAIPYYGAFAGALLLTGAVFLGNTPNSRCLIEPYDNKSIYPNLTEDFIKEVFIPWNSKAKDYDRCKRNIFEDVGLCANNLNSTCISQLINSTDVSVVECTDGYVYDQSIFESTIVTEWDLVCAKGLSNAFTNFAFYLGLFSGSIVGGILSDRFGRIKVYRTVPILMFIAVFSGAYSPNVYVYSVFRFLSAFFEFMAVVAVFTYVAEITKRNWRIAIGLGYNAFFGSGCMVLSLLAYAWRDWRSLEIAISVSILPLVPLSWLMPESPRWLCFKGRLAEANKICVTMAKRNGTELSADVWSETEKHYNSENNEKGKTNTNSLKETFSRPYTRFFIVAVMFVWAITCMVYFGLILNTGSLVGNIFINNAIGGLMELLADVVAIPVISFIGFTRTTGYSLFIASATCLVSTVTLQLGSHIIAVQNFATALAMIGKFGASLAFGVLYQHTVEMFATVGRSTAFGLSMMAARIGSLFSPFTVQTNYEMPWLSPTIFGATSMLAAILALTFRETKGKELPTTFDEAERKFQIHLQGTITAKVFCLPKASGKKSDDDQERGLFSDQNV